jgi:heavy metal efflux system protein
MLNHVIVWSLRNPFLVLVGALGFAVLGVWSVLNLGIDAFPDTTPVQVQVNTAVPGMAAQDIERQVTFVLEQTLSGLPSLKAVRSLSQANLSQVTLVFDDGVSIYFARQQIAERLTTVELPEAAARPTLGPIATGLGEVFHYLVFPRKEQTGNPFTDPTEPTAHNLIAARSAQDWVLRPALRTVPGTAEVNSWGGAEKQYQVRINPARLFEFELTFDQVVQAVRDNSLTVGGGYVTKGGATFSVRGLGRADTLERIRAGVIATRRDGVPIKLSDVAEVDIGQDLRMGGVTADGRGEAVLGLGFTLMGANSHEVTVKLRDKFLETKERLPEEVKAIVAYDRTELIDQVLDTVRRNLFEGGLLVVAVLFVFLGNLRAGVVVALAIPLSMLFAFSGMLQFAIAGSLLSLGAIDFGLVVDSSVVMVENVMRHLEDEAKGRTHFEVVRDAALEVRVPTMFGELIIMIVYLPILTLQGVEGKMFRPMALTVIFALLGSMILSMTVMPVLAYLCLGKGSWLGRLLGRFSSRRRAEDLEEHGEQEPLVVRAARMVYAPILNLSLHMGSTVLALTVATLAIGVLVLINLGGEFVPRLSEGTLVVNILRLPGTDLNEAMRYNTRMEKLLLRKFPTEVRHVWSRTGTAEVATDPMGPEETDFFITLRPTQEWRVEWRGKGQQVVEEAIREEFNDLPGQRLTYTQPIGQRVDEMISGVRGQVAVKLFGDDFDELAAGSEAIERILNSTQGAVDVGTEQLGGLPEVQVRPRQEVLGRYGMTPRLVLERVAALGGRVVGDVMEGQMRFPLAVRLPRGLRTDPEALGSLLITTPTGEQVSLGRLAEVSVEEGHGKIQREWGQRRVVTQCNVRGRDIAGFVEEVREAINNQVIPSLPKNGRYRIEYGGQFQTYQEAMNRLWIVFPVALVLILLLLYLTYRRVIDVLLVVPAIPFAWVGGVLALWWREMPLSIPAGVGFIALSGVAVLNSMVMVSFIRHLRERGVEFEEAIREAALTRLRPVLMTALVASLGFMPMALSTGVGAEVQRPLATVVVGGIVSATVMTLLALPVLYRTFGPRTA